MLFIDDLEQDPGNKALLNTFFGLLGGFLVATTGHRRGVLINMTIQEVNEAEQTRAGGRIIRVSKELELKVKA